MNLLLSFYEANITFLINNGLNSVECNLHLIGVYFSNGPFITPKSQITYKKGTTNDAASA